MPDDSMPQVENSAATGQSAKRAIEEGFPIVEINRLAEPERNAFKPINQMHKWFARRASCVFRAILLGALKPAGTDIMEEFYKDHTHDPDTNGKVILDPFMGGGTTVVEALRLGCKVIGIDLNPVAWFIVKTEVEPVDLDELRAAFERLAAWPTASGKPLREELLSHYKTECPACGNSDADIIYVFWVKSAICTDAKCRKQVPLFPNYLVAQKTPSIRYYGDVRCPNARCGKKFDWEIQPAALVGEARLMVASGLDGAGETRSNRRWSYAPAPDAKAQDARAREARVTYPWCNQTIAPILSQKKTERKKVKLSVLHCPHCAEVSQYRGTPSETVTCPACRKECAWEKGNVPDKGKFVCACGNRDKIIESIRKLPADQLLPMRMYALEGYCARCAGGEEEEDGAENGHLWEGPFVAPVSDRRPVAAVFPPPSPAVAALYERRHSTRRSSPAATKGLIGGDASRRSNFGGHRPPLQDNASMLSKNNGKFFKRISVADEARYQQACERWEKEKETLPYPKQEIPDGQETHRLLEHHYRYWHQMFNPRQLLCLASLLRAIDEEPRQTLKEMLLVAFSSSLESNNLFCRYTIRGGNKSQGIFSRHDFQPKVTLTENNVWGTAFGHGAFTNKVEILLTAKQDVPRLLSDDSGSTLHVGFPSFRYQLVSQSSCTIDVPAAANYCVTDPPYAGNVNYSELSDFFYVWLRLFLAKTYTQFAPEVTPKADEIIENPTRGKTAQDFENGLRQVFAECRRVSRDDALLVFTFHHAEDRAWESLLRAVCDSGWEVGAVYPLHGEAENTMNVMAGTKGITYDLVHVCRKRASDAAALKRSWAGIRQEIRRRAREEIKRIEAGRYGRGLKGPDVNLILIGKCLELYSRHYGAVVTEENGVERTLPLREALGEIRFFVDQLVSGARPLPSELEDIDRESRVYLTALCEKTEIKSDDVNKATRGIIEVGRLLEAGLMKRGRAKRGRTYEVYSPFERYKDLAEKFRDRQSLASATGNLFGEDVGAPRHSKAFLMDKLHFLMGLAQEKEDLGPWISRWSGDLPQLRAAAEYLAKRQEKFAPVLKRVLGRMEVGPLLERGVL
jgi:adenine-specific DNA methylase